MKGDNFIRYEVPSPMLELAQKRTLHFLDRRNQINKPLSWLLAFAYLQGGFDMAYALGKAGAETDEQSGNDYQI